MSHILDDGKRDEFRRFAEEAGIGYAMTRDDNAHAKAGNINRALARRFGLCPSLPSSIAITSPRAASCRSRSGGFCAR